MAEGSKRYLQRSVETVAGETPSSPTMTKLRNTGGSGILNERTSVTSEEIRSDRSIVEQRMGNNQPNITIPIEKSFESFEDLMQGALGGTWTADYLLTETVSFGVGGTITLDDASDWITKGLAVGNYIVITNATTAGNDGVYYVSAFADSGGTNDEMTVLQADGSTGATFVADTADEIGIQGGYIGGRVDTSANTITVANTGSTYTAASALWVTTFNIHVGDNIYFAGFTNAGNVGYKKVTAVTDTVLTVTSSTTLVDEALSTGNLDIGSNVAILTCGADGLDSFLIEEGHTDIDQYVYTTGAKVGTYSLNIQPDAVVTGEFGMQGTTYSGYSGSSIAGSVVEANTNNVFDSYTGDLYFGGVSVCAITGFNFSLDNGLNRRYALMQKDACNIGEGRTNVTGAITAFFNDSTFVDRFDNETEVECRIRLEDLDGNAYVFGFPVVKLSSLSKDVTENDVTLNSNFQALGGATLTTMYIRKQTAI